MRQTWKVGDRELTVDPELPSTTVAGDPRITSREHHEIGEQNSRATRITIEEALILQSFGFTNRPSPTVTGHGLLTRHPSGQQKMVRDAIEAGEWVSRDGEDPHKPGFTPREGYVGISEEFRPEAINGEPDDNAQLQSFPQPIHVAGRKGKQFLQVGNAVPPLMAQRVLEAMWDMEPQEPVWAPPVAEISLEEAA